MRSLLPIWYQLSHEPKQKPRVMAPIAFLFTTQRYSPTGKSMASVLILGANNFSSLKPRPNGYMPVHMSWPFSLSPHAAHGWCSNSVNQNQWIG